MKEKMNSTTQPNHQTEQVKCKNCDHEFSGKYCPNCGQSVKELERPIRFMIADFMGTIITFDTRIIKTLYAVLLQPGKLTVDYLAGKRARYMPPFRFYLFISFVMFLLISTVTNKSIDNNYDVTKDGIINTTNEISAITDSIKTGQDSIFVSTRQIIQQELDSAHIDSTNLEHLNDISSDVVGFITDMEGSLDDNDSKYAKTIKKILDYPELYINKLYQYTSWSLFLFMPAFAFFLWVLFHRSKKLYIGHLIFALNIHSFIFSITAVIILTNMIFPNQSVAWIGYLYFLLPVYQTIGARRIYKRKWVSTFLKLTLVWVMYTFVWFIGLAIIAAIAFVGL